MTWSLTTLFLCALSAYVGFEIGRSYARTEVQDRGQKPRALDVEPSEFLHGWGEH